MNPRICLSKGRILTASLPAFIMGIVNATPDSFWAQSRSGTLAAGLERALVMTEEGADMLDIGGESTRPGSVYIDEAEELRRVIPLVREIRKHTSIPISIDTRRSSVMKAALDEGADILNDISALEDDPGMIPLAAGTGIPVILMHKKGEPENMQNNPVYTDAVHEVSAYLFNRAEIVRQAGIQKEKIILDPGIGFGKRYEDNCALIAGLAEIGSEGYPVLMALSRKSFIGQITGRDTDNRLPGTLAANMLAVLNGAAILRVHDVAPARDMLAVLQEISNFGNHKET
ncbi:dihydropteroate synthase [Brucepastera parasyntrophica]|uniref:dihydropteroate synthase n=1 Tax=Brucepastera parasyntrophica TaxID=2880008 RepID=UPI00210EBD82|nr:dihydropteroate synthase [Brucepastera parasyntrophica]ULQ59709.1 dihydropteroate synthase [Brucepastera parasyntrophica]